MAKCILSAEYASDFSVSRVFADDMVVQRNEHIRVWGFAPESENGKKVEGVLIYEREYPVKDSRLVVKAGGSSMKDSPEYIYLIDYRNGVRIDLKKEDPRNYVKTMTEE